MTTTRPIRSQKTGIVLPRQGTFVSAIENLGRQLSSGFEDSLAVPC